MANVEVLPNNWDEGLTSTAITKVNSLCREINQETGLYLKTLVSNIVEIRQTLKEDRNWLVFCTSNQIPFSSRQIRDFVQAKEWLMATNVPDKMLGRLSSRTIARISGVQNEEVLGEIESRLNDGEVLSYPKVMDIIGILSPGGGKVKEKSSNQSELDKASKKEVYEWFLAKTVEVEDIKEEMETLKAGVQMLSRENKQLKEMLEIFKGLSQNYQATTVATKAVNGNAVVG